LDLLLQKLDTLGELNSQLPFPYFPLVQLQTEALKDIYFGLASHQISGKVSIPHFCGKKLTITDLAHYEF